MSKGLAGVIAGESAISTVGIGLGLNYRYNFYSFNLFIKIKEGMT